jgi:hypothetical protein
MADRFWPKVDRGAGPDACWPWTASTTHGYGQIGVPGTRPHKAHRVAWELTNGPIPDGLLVCHRCDNPPCCNPAHLFLGTNADNMRDMVAKGRAGSRTAAGDLNPKARLTPEQVQEIRAAIASGEKFSELARRMGVSWTAVGNIAKGKTWSLDLVARKEALVARLESRVARLERQISSHRQSIDGLKAAALAKAGIT